MNNPYYGPPNGQQPAPPNYKKIARLSILGVVILVLLIAVFSSFYSIGESEQGVVTLFGKVTNVVDAGLHFKLPWPIQSVAVVPVNVIQGMEVGYRSTPAGSVSVESECKMITGDKNIVNVDFFVEWRITDPEKYLFASSDPETILRNVIQSCARSVIGSQGVDSVLTTGKTMIQTTVREQTTLLLDAYDIGVTVLEVKIQDAEPPTSEVIAAFKNVETAKQEMATYINQATEYSNEKIPQSKSEIDRILREAESAKLSRISKAEGEAAMFNEMFSEYIKNPEITRTRMKLEMFEEVLPSMKLFILTQETNLEALLPIDTFTAG